MEKSKIQIFLAHANEDKEAVLELYERLKEAGYRPWLDKKDLIPGQNWRSVIPEVIAKSQLFIACLSERSIAKRGYVQNEFKIALNQLASLPSNSIYFIPLRLDECEIPDLRQNEYGLNLRDIQWLDYWEADGFENLEKAIAYQFKFPTNDEPSTQSQNFIQDLGNGINLEMIYIPGGTFMMGSPEGEGQKYEKPQHKVTVPPFFMGKYPITQAQYLQITGQNPSHFQDNDQRPVERVSWDDTVEFCQKLSKLTGREYRLPTEAEWEYACRAGTKTSFYLGLILTPKLARCKANVGESLVSIVVGVGDKTSAVGQFPPNAFDLYDMHGNVWEWCQDNWHDNYINAPTDGSAWLSGKSSKKVVRGGSWANSPDDCCSAYRGISTRGDRDDIFGFRVVCVVPRTT